MGTCEGRVGCCVWVALYMRCNGSNWAAYNPRSWDGFRNDLCAWWAPEVGGYVRIIIFIIIIISNLILKMKKMLRREVQNVQTLHTKKHFCPAGNHPGTLKVTQSVNRSIWSCVQIRALNKSCFQSVSCLNETLSRKAGINLGTQKIGGGGETTHGHKGERMLKRVEHTSMVNLYVWWYKESRFTSPHPPCICQWRKAYSCFWIWMYTHIVVVFPAPLRPKKDVICPS